MDQTKPSAVILLKQTRRLNIDSSLTFAFDYQIKMKRRFCSLKSQTTTLFSEVNSINLYLYQLNLWQLSQNNPLIQHVRVLFVCVAMGVWTYASTHKWAHLLVSIQRHLEKTWRSETPDVDKNNLNIGNAASCYIPQSCRIYCRYSGCGLFLRSIGKQREAAGMSSLVWL